MHLQVYVPIYISLGNSIERANEENEIAKAKDVTERASKFIELEKLV